MDVELKRKLEAFKRDFPNVLQRSTAQMLGHKDWR